MIALLVLVSLGLTSWSVIATIELIARDGYRPVPDRMWESHLDQRLPPTPR